MSVLFMISDTRAQYRLLPIHLVSPADGVTPDVADNGGQPQISKQGGAFVNTAGVLVLVGNGYYTLQLTAADLNTAGLILVRFKSANCLEYQIDGQVVGFDPYSGPWATTGSVGVSFTWTSYDNTPPNIPNTVPETNVAVSINQDASSPIINPIVSGVTNALGQIPFLLPPGTYQLWQFKPGVNFTNPTQIVVSS